MPIYTAINKLKKTTTLNDLEATESFLNSLTIKLQMQIIAAIYIGRNHNQSTKWNQDIMLSVKYIDHIPQEHFANILYEKRYSLPSYLNSIELCAKNEGFDLNLL